MCFVNRVGGVDAVRFDTVSHLDQAHPVLCSRVSQVADVAESELAQFVCCYVGSEDDHDLAAVQCTFRPCIVSLGRARQASAHGRAGALHMLSKVDTPFRVDVRGAETSTSMM